MIRISITCDRAGRGKTLMSMKLAKLLSENGFDVTVLTEPTSDSVLNYMLDIPFENFMRIDRDVVIHDTNNTKYNPNIHVDYRFNKKSTNNV